MKKNYKPLTGLVITSLLCACSLFSFAGQFQVTNTNNAGAGSLSDAITQANASPGTDTITFALTEGTSMTFAPTTALPAITEALFIDGYSQPGAVLGNIASRTIRLNIDGAGLPIVTDIFAVNSTGVEIAGFAIYRAPNFGCGIRINFGGSAFIWGNYVGTDSTGLATGLGNTYSGIVCNTFSGAPNSNSGVIVGINGDGTNDVNEGNLISCNGEDGIFFWRTTGSTIAGNIIGFDKNGVGTGFGNGRNGILLATECHGNTIGTNGDFTADNLEINRIGNNSGRGIYLTSVSNNNVIAGNVIGLNATNAAAGNIIGIEINPGSGNRIGTNGDFTSDALERNTICSNSNDGITINGSDNFGASNSNGNIISGNAIGTNGAGTLVRGNGANGIRILSEDGFNANDNIIGSNEDGVGDDGEGNIIANNVRGIAIDAPIAPSTLLGNRISRNSIYDNTQLGIDHLSDGVTGNDNGDGDTGPNELYNFPVITKANVQGGSLVIAGIAGPGALIEFYIADANGSEGRTYLFTAQEGGTYTGNLGTITDDSSGTDSYSDVLYGTFTDEKFGFSVLVSGLPSPVTAGTIIIALATNTTTLAGSTSEFGPSFISTLPVRFVQFNGRVSNGVVSLTWNTSQEVGNSHFDVERSSNGTAFEKIGTVSALGGINNAYSFSDTKPGNVNFYRLKQVDKNGTKTYSKTLVIRGDLDKIVAKVTPNPFVGSVNVSFQAVKAETVSVRLYSQNGQLVKQQSTKVNTGINTVNLGDLNNLPAGNYTLELRGETINFKQQVVKQ